MKLDDDTYEKMRKKYADKLDNSFNEEEVETNTRQYDEFRKENLPKPFSWYEDACVNAEKLLPLKPDSKKIAELEEAIEACHLQVTPAQTFSFAALTSLSMVLLSLIFLFMAPYLFNKDPDMFIMMFALIGSVIVFFSLNKVPIFLANTWRMKSSNQMVLAIFYIVTYMRHTSNLELAIDFAAEHLDPPFSLDMKKIVWDMETGKYSSLRQSLDSYMLKWEKLNPQFVESMQNIESSLLESSEQRRLETLDKALSIMLEDTFEQMIHYTHDLKSPITTLHMLGIILPILGLVILPLLVSFMPAVKWIHIAVIYNIALPLSVYFLGKNILSNRPGGYGHSETISKDVRVSVAGFKLTPIFIAILVFSVCFFIAIIPLLVHFVNPNFDVISKGDSEGFHTVDVSYEDELEGAKNWFLEYRMIDYQKGDQTISESRGPFGVISSMLSLFFIIAFGVGIGLYYKFRTGDAMKMRRSAEKIELEFASALFQLGNRLADGLPLEIAFSKVSAAMSHSMTGKFFDLVSSNIARLGMSVEEAIFDPQYGALRYFPSNIIESSMKVLTESAKKGPLVASSAIINVSNYIKQMHRVDERLKDLLADVVSSMTSQIRFLTPVIAGIVVGITSMITGILGTLTRQFAGLQGDLAGGGMDAAGGMGGMLSSMKGGIPSYFFQLVVGLYVVQIVYILTSLVVGIENGSDKLGEQHSLGQNLVKSTLLYVILTGVVMFLFNMIAGSIVTPGG